MKLISLLFDFDISNYIVEYSYTLFIYLYIEITYLIDLIFEMLILTFFKGDINCLVFHLIFSSSCKDILKKINLN